MDIYKQIIREVFYFASVGAMV